MKYHKITPDMTRDTAYWHNAIVHWGVIATLLVWAASIVLLVLFVHPSDEPLRLQYNVFFGTSLHAPWWQAYFLPMVGLVFIVVDIVIGWLLYRAHERVAAYMMLLSGLFVAIALVIAVASVVMNNFLL